jgi:16S rRNA (cytosine967-C5)-methyltransferase
LPISPARLAAFRILHQLEQHRGIAVELLHSEIAASLHPKDQALTTELVYGVFRQRTLLDYVLARHSHTPLDKLDLPVRLALRLGTYQRLFLSRIPAWAAINDSVELVKRARLRSAAAFVNAVLRRIRRDELEKVLAMLDRPTDTALSVRFSHPEWLICRWRERFGEETLLRLLELNNQNPRTFFRINDPRWKHRPEEEFKRHGIGAEAHPFVEACWQLLGGELHKTALCQEGRVVLQDPASQIIPFLLEPRQGNWFLDVCSAPGGKVSQLARLSGENSTIVGIDINWRRVKIAQKLHGRHWPTIKFLVADGSRPLPFSICFDKILLDAPCSGTGTLRRNPDIRWRLSLRDFPLLNHLQCSLLANAAHYLKPGGMLVYSTCSLEKEENEDVINRFLEGRPDFQLSLPKDKKLHRFFNSQGFFEWLPSEFNNDGFFAAILRKQEAAVFRKSP